jgi:hypothetical protein
MSKRLKTVIYYAIAFLVSFGLHHIVFSRIASKISVFDVPFEIVKEEVEEKEVEEDKFEIVEKEVEEQEQDKSVNNNDEKIDELKKDAPALLDPAFNNEKALKKTEVIKVRKKPARLPSCATIQKIGMALLSKGAGMGDGSFPSMSINYDNPLSYIKAMYEMGVRTFVYRESLKRLIGEIDLLNYSYNPQAKVHQEISPIKRVIHDEMLNSRKEMILSQSAELNGDEKLLLIFPKDLEARYLGYQKWLMENVAKVKFSCVAHVDTCFDTKKKRLFVTGILLDDGTRIEIDDPFGM